MKTSNFIVRIPEPCHEDWNKMKPDVKGKFCNYCNKSVFDFSTKSDTEIKDILLEYKDQKVCGHFKKSQINRPLNISVNFNDLPRNINTTRAFAIALFLVFGVFLFSCTDKHGQKIEKIEVIEYESDKEHYTVGMTNFNMDPPLLLDSMNIISSTLTGDTVVIIREEYIDGGVSYDETSIEETEYAPIAKDTVNYEEPMMLGMMVIPYTDPISDSVASSDSMNILDTKKMKDEVDLKSKELLVYPNPSNGEFTIKYELKKKTNVRIDLIDIKGILIKTFIDVANQYDGKYQIPVNLNELPNGIYLVNLIKGDEKFVERIVIER